GVKGWGLDIYSLGETVFPHVPVDSGGIPVDTDFLLRLRSRSYARRFSAVTSVRGASERARAIASRSPCARPSSIATSAISSVGLPAAIRRARRSFTPVPPEDH